MDKLRSRVSQTGNLNMKTKLFSLTIVAFLFLSPVNALACACCAEPGHYFSDSTNLDDDRLSQLKRIRFGRTASLYLTAAGIDEDSEGIEQPNENYSLTSSFAGNVLKLSFLAGTTTSVLDLPLPAKKWDHSVDIHDGKLSPGGGPLLYKEWRFEGDVTGTGVFKAGTSSPAKYTLILQGRGNGCDNAENFSHWRLNVKGEKADFAFYGRFLRPVRNR